MDRFNREPDPRPRRTQDRQSNAIFMIAVAAGLIILIGVYLISTPKPYEQEGYTPDDGFVLTSPATLGYVQEFILTADGDEIDERLDSQTIRFGNFTLSTTGEDLMIQWEHEMGRTTLHDSNLDGWGDRLILEPFLPDYPDLEVWARVDSEKERVSVGLRQEIYNHLMDRVLAHIDRYRPQR